MNSKTKTLVFKKPYMLRRLGAAIIDLIVVLLLTVFFAFIVNTALYHNDKYVGYKDTYNYYALESGLYTMYNGDKNVSRLVEYNEESDDYFYYIAYPEVKDKYDEMKSESNLFDFDSSTNKYIEKSDADEKQLKDFYTNAANVAINKYFDNYINSIDEAKVAKYYINVYNYINVCSSIALSLLLTLLLIPMVNKNAKTLGKVFFRLKVVSTKTGTNISKIQCLVRQLVLILVEYTSSIFFISLMYIPLSLIVSLIMLFVMKKQQSFHDFVCSTIVVDELDFGDIRENQKIYLEVESEN